MTEPMPSIGENKMEDSDDAEFLAWCADRFHFQYGEMEGLGWMQRLRKLASEIRARGIVTEQARGCLCDTCKLTVQECRAKNPTAQQAPAISLPKDMTNIQCIDEGLKGLSDYFNAALEGEESKAALRRMWDQQMGIMFALLKNYGQAPATDLRILPNGEEYSISQIMEIQRYLKEHDAAIAAQAREDVLTEIEHIREREYVLCNARILTLPNISEKDQYSFMIMGYNKILRILRSEVGK